MLQAVQGIRAGIQYPMGVQAHGVQPAPRFGMAIPADPLIDPLMQTLNQKNYSFDTLLEVYGALLKNVAERSLHDSLWEPAAELFQKRLLQGAKLPKNSYRESEPECRDFGKLVRIYAVAEPFKGKLRGSSIDNFLKHVMQELEKYAETLSEDPAFKSKQENATHLLKILENAPVNFPANSKLVLLLRLTAEDENRTAK